MEKVHINDLAKWGIERENLDPIRRCMGWHGCPNNAVVQAKGQRQRLQWFCIECISLFGKINGA